MEKLLPLMSPEGNKFSVPLFPVDSGLLRISEFGWQVIIIFPYYFNKKVNSCRFKLPRPKKAGFQTLKAGFRGIYAGDEIEKYN